MRQAGALACLALATTEVAGHGALVNPPSRNAYWDRTTHPNVHPPMSSCGCANTSGTCDNAQACYWYQQGCTIGCDKCDDLTGRGQIDLCGKGKEPTINKPEYCTVNRAHCGDGTELDVYKHNPWRAPGSAPTRDACGMAGGSPHQVPEWGDYIETEFAKQGDLGSKVLKETPSGTVWHRGALGEAVWQVTANHGGGYQYRLCPATEDLTEECFQRHPLEFARKQSLVWANGTKTPITGTFVSEGVIPANSTWAMAPIPPRCLSGHCSDKNVCHVCAKGDTDCTPCDDTNTPSFPPPCDEARDGACSGNEHGVAVSDMLVVPDVPPGKYVLGWRYDCEATAQIWSNCADIRIA